MAKVQTHVESRYYGQTRYTRHIAWGRGGAAPLSLSKTMLRAFILFIFYVHCYYASIRIIIVCVHDVNMARGDTDANLFRLA